MTSMTTARIPLGCLICNQPSLYTYYGVRCCEGCKQFFRRAVMKQKEYECKKENKCQLEKGERCLGCRFNKCILVGMEMTRINCHSTATGDGDRRQYMQRIQERKKRMMEEEGEEENGGEKRQKALPKTHKELALYKNLSALNMKTMDFLLPIGIKHRRIWEMSTDLPAGYLDHLESLEDLVQFPGNILNNADQIGKKKPPFWDRAKYLANCEEYCLAPEDIGFLSVDRLLLVDTFKSLPIFAQLAMDDKIALLKHIAAPSIILWNFYYSALSGAKTWIRGNGLVFLDGFHASCFKMDSILNNMTMKCLCESVEIVNKLQLNLDEFLLLLMILFSSSAPSNLSSTARDQLYAESNRLTRTLLNLLQIRLGTAGGAVKQMECLQMLDTLFRIAHVYGLMKTYLEVVILKEDLMSKFPKPLLEIDF